MSASEATVVRRHRPAAPPPVQPSDFDLVRRVRNGDLASFDHIVSRYNQRLYRVSRSVLRDDAEAEDVVQETYVRAFTKLNDFKGPNGFASWLVKIAFNESLRRLQKRKRTVSLDDGLASPAGSSDVVPLDVLRSEDPGPERQAASAELHHDIVRALEALPMVYRTVFVLRAIEELSIAETAECLSLPGATVKTRYFRACRQLRKSLAFHQDDVGVTQLLEFGGWRCARMVRRVARRLIILTSRSDCVGADAQQDHCRPVPNHRTHLVGNLSSLPVSIK